jgi:hypothetical protein
MAVINGYIDVQEVPIWDKEEAKQFIERIAKDIRYHVEGHIPPTIQYGSKGWLCDSCQYTDLCSRDASCSLGTQSMIETDEPRNMGIYTSKKAIIKIDKK